MKILYKISHWIFFLLFCTPAYAQDAVPGIPQSILKISPQHFVQDALKIGIERFNSSFKNSGVIYLSGVIGSHNDSAGQSGFNGFGLEAQRRKYFNSLKIHTSKKENPYYQGIFLAGFIQGGYYSGDQHHTSWQYDSSSGDLVKVTNYNYSQRIINYGAGFTIGFQWIAAEVLSFETFVGGGFQFANRTFSGDVPDNIRNNAEKSILALDYSGVLPKIGFKIGIGL
jgi:hypothetical protein